VSSSSSVILPQFKSHTLLTLKYQRRTLASVQPPDVTYNLAMPAALIEEGELSALQLEVRAIQHFICLRNHPVC